MLSVNDFIVNIRVSRYELREMTYKNGLITYIPAEKK